MSTHHRCQKRVEYSNINSHSAGFHYICHPFLKYSRYIVLDCLHHWVWFHRPFKKLMSQQPPSPPWPAHLEPGWSASVSSLGPSIPWSSLSRFSPVGSPQFQSRCSPARGLPPWRSEGTSHKLERYSVER